MIAHVTHSRLAPPARAASRRSDAARAAWPNAPDVKATRVSDTMRYFIRRANYDTPALALLILHIRCISAGRPPAS